MTLKTPIRISMQYFAEGDAGSQGNTQQTDSQNTQQNQNGNSAAGDQNQQNQNNNSGATFSQDDLNRIGAKEKANGRKSMLKELGFDDEKAAKDAMSEFKKWQESQKTEAQKAQDKINQAESSKTAAEQRAQAAESKLEIIKAGGNAKFVDDIMALVNIRVNDSTDFDKALESVKKDHPSFFGAESGSGDSGTGGSLNRQNNNKNTKSDGIGARLAQNRLKNTPTKNPYFDN